MEAQTITIEIYTIVFIIIFYAIVAIITKPVIEMDIENYVKNNIFHSISARIYLENYKMHIYVIGSLMFPFYYMFTYGWWFGKKFYSILIDNKDENRIASWLF